jgi:hypothetical protein
LRTDVPPASLGSTWATGGQLKALMARSIVVVQETWSLYAIRRNTAGVVAAQDQFFRQTLMARYYDSPDILTEYATTIQACLTSFVLQEEPLVFGREITRSIVNTSVVLNQQGNLRPLSQSILRVGDLLVKDLEGIGPTIDRTSTILLPCIIVVILVIPIVSLFFEARWIKSNKERTYHCLAALPKSTVSELAERLRAIKKEQDSEADAVSNASEITKRKEHVVTRIEPTATRLSKSARGPTNCTADSWNHSPWRPKIAVPAKIISHWLRLASEEFWFGVVSCWSYCFGSGPLPHFAESVCEHVL